MVHIRQYDDEPQSTRLSELLPLEVEDVREHIIKFSYEAALLRGCDCSLDGPHLTEARYKQYFKRTKQLSKLTIDQFEQLNHGSDHTVIQPYSAAGKTLKVFLQDVVADVDFSNPKTEPLIGQFSLYQSSSDPCRVHFILGSMGLLYVVALDEHTLRPMTGGVPVPQE